jgi:S-(hydroxymethyl)glutathione dehydrogenase / alcohol dehydrogenase
MILPVISRLSAPLVSKAAILVELNEPLLVTDIHVPVPDIGQVVVKVYYSGLCGKQLGEQTGSFGPDRFIPHLMGHEASVEVLECGPGVAKVKAGDVAVAHWRVGSGIESPFPKYWCPTLDTYVGAGRIATFTEYAIVSENRLTPIPDDIPRDIAALLGCAVTTGLGLVANEAHISLGQSVVVFGVGGIGINVIQGCRLVSAHPIVAVDIVDSKLEMATGFGATHTINSYNKHRNDLREELLLTLNGGEFDICIDTSGNGAILDLALDVLNQKGTLYLVGQMAAHKRVSIQTAPLHAGKRIECCFGGDTDPDRDIPRYINLLQSGKLDLNNIITHESPLDDINKLMDNARLGVVGRGIVKL